MFVDVERKPGLECFDLRAGPGMPGNERVLGQSTHESRRLERPAQIVCGLRISLLHRFISDYQTECKFLPDDMRVSVLPEKPADEFRVKGMWQRVLHFSGGGLECLWLLM